MCPSAPRVCSEPGGQKPVLSLSLDLIGPVTNLANFRSVHFTNPYLSIIMDKPQQSRWHSRPRMMTMMMMMIMMMIIKKIRICHVYHERIDANLIVVHRTISLQWRHNGRDGFSNHHHHHCLLNHLFRRRSKKTSKLHVTDLCEGIHRWPVNSPHKGTVMQKMFPFDDVIVSR